MQVKSPSNALKTGLGDDNGKNSNHSSPNEHRAHVWPGAGLAAANPAQLRDGWSPRQKREASVGFLRTPRAAQPQGLAVRKNAARPADEPNAQEDLKARQRLQLFLEIHGTETHPRWGLPKAAEGALCLEGLPQPESNASHA